MHSVWKAAVIGGIVGMLGQAEANSTQRYPGSHCVQSGTSGTYRVTSRSAVYNANTSENLTVECPFDSAGANDYMGAGFLAGFWYVDDTSSGGVTCTANIHDNDSNATTSITKTCSANDNNYRFCLLLTSALKTSYELAAMSFRCTIPDEQGGHAYLTQYRASIGYD